MNDDVKIGKAKHINEQNDLLSVEQIYQLVVLCSKPFLHDRIFLILQAHNKNLRACKRHGPLL